MHRNMANQCLNSDMSFLAVLSYAINVLDVQELLVMGHYGCGGVKASCTRADHGLPEHWIRNVRDVQRLHMDELSVRASADGGGGARG